MEIRDNIIEHTFKLLLNKGYDGVSISDIHSAVGISRGLLYHYFSNKHDLFVETLQSKFSQSFCVDLQYIKNLGIYEMTSYIVRKYKTFNTEVLDGVPILNYDFVYYRAMQQSDAIADMYRKIREDERAGWLIALQNSQRMGEIDPKLDIEMLATQYILVTDGVWMSAVTPSIELDLISGLQSALDFQNSLIKKIKENCTLFERMFKT